MATRRFRALSTLCLALASWHWQRAVLGPAANLQTKPLIIINQSAARVRRLWPTIQQELAAAGIEYEAYETKAPGDATTCVRAALKSGTESIIVVGGDGTLSEAAEGFFEFNENHGLEQVKDRGNEPRGLEQVRKRGLPPLDDLPTAINPSATLAILPAGTGDDFARGLTGRRAPLNEWIETLTSGVVRQVDVLYGRCNGYEKPFICLNASTMGIGGETAGRVAAQGKFMRNFSGEFRFVFAALGALAVWRERRVIVTVDGRTIADGPMNLVAVANALYAGGGMMLSPEASIDDGKLDVITASGLSRANVVTELSRVHTGGHVKNPKVTITQGEIVRIETLMLQDAMPLEADGNVRGVTPVQFQVLPGALRFLSSA